MNTISDQRLLLSKEISADGERDDSHKPDDAGKTFASTINVVKSFGQTA